MFDSANLDHVVDKATWKKEEPVLREALLKAQLDLAAQKRFPVLVLVGGVEGAGKGEAVNKLLEWFDPRAVHVHAFGEPTDEERERPAMWRFWRGLPPRGRVGVFFGAWHTQPIVNRALGRTTEDGFENAIGDIVRFERMLADEGVLLLKFWFHLTRKQQKRRFKDLSSDPRTAWRVTDLEWKYHRSYDDFVPTAEQFLQRTSTGDAPWFVIPGADEHYRNLLFGKTLLASMQERLAQGAPPVPVDRTPAFPEPVDAVNVINTIDLKKKLSKAKFEKELEHWQGRLALLSRHKRFKKTSVVLVFEGADAAGKGGAIRRITGALDARVYQGIPVAAPTEEERAQPYLWRFWRHMPGRGRFVMFDRSWYGRLLVERVEGFCSESDWMRGYSEIVDFEQQMVDHGYIILKFWLQISQKEQLRRFKERERTAWKRFKITPEDWRNREKWDAYQGAVCDMIDRTSTDAAPWKVIAAEDKNLARVTILKTLVEAIEARLDLSKG